MISYTCDVCGEGVTRESAVIDDKEITIELPGKKVSLSIHATLVTSHRDEHAAVCARCMAARFASWHREASADAQ